jgi:phosphatidylglycerol:prolipoprotein diacylglycerol transferase
VPEDKLFNLSFYTLLAGILGAKAALVLVDFDVYVRHPRMLLGTVRTAGVVIGGVIAGAIVFFLYARRHGLPLFRLGDAIAAPLALGQAVGRLGCHSAGCCWGVPACDQCHLAVTFTDPVAASQTGVPLNIPLVPTQLLHMTGNLALTLLLTLLWRRKLEPAGTVFWFYVLLYSISRGVIEFWRGDEQRGLFFGDTVSTSQLLSLGGILLASIMLARGGLPHRRPAGSKA